MVVDRESTSVLNFGTELPIGSIQISKGKYCLNLNRLATLELKDIYCMKLEYLNIGTGEP